MSEADKMLEKLGYKKYTSDDCIMYMKDLFMITFILDNKTFVTEYKQGDYNFPKIRPFEVNMQELQAINKKVEELRMDIEEQWREKTLRDIQEGRVIVAYIEKDEEGNTIIGYIQKIC